MGAYQVEIKTGVKVKAKIIDNPSLVYQNICELRSLLHNRVVGLDVKLQSSFWPWIGNTARMLILCVENRCLMIQLDRLDMIPDSLRNFLADDSICFVGKDLSHKLACLCRATNVTKCKTGVEVGDLAARVLKKPYISTIGLAYLANEAGVGSSVAVTGGPGPVDWNARAFTDEEIKYAVHEAYACYVIGNKLLGMLSCLIN